MSLDNSHPTKPILKKPIIMFDEVVFFQSKFTIEIFYLHPSFKKLLMILLSPISLKQNLLIFFLIFLYSIQKFIHILSHVWCFSQNLVLNFLIIIIIIIIIIILYVYKYLFIDLHLLLELLSEYFFICLYKYLHVHTRGERQLISKLMSFICDLWLSLQEQLTLCCWICIVTFLFV